MRTLVTASLFGCLLMMSGGPAWGEEKMKAMPLAGIDKEKTDAAHKLVDVLFESMLPPIRNKVVARATSDALRKMGKEAARPLVAKMVQWKGLPSFGREAADILGDMGPEAGGVLSELTSLLDENGQACQEVREAAIEALGKILKQSLVLNSPKEAKILEDYQPKFTKLKTDVLDAIEKVDKGRPTDEELAEKIADAESTASSFLHEVLGVNEPSRKRHISEAQLDHLFKLTAAMSAENKEIGIIEKGIRQDEIRAVAAFLFNPDEAESLNAAKTYVSLPEMHSPQLVARGYHVVKALSEIIKLVDATFEFMKELPPSTVGKQAHAVNTLTHLLEDPCFTIRILAAEALARIYDKGNR